MNDSIHVTVVDWFEDLLDAVARVSLRVELPGHDVLEEFATRHPATHSGE